MNSAKRQKIYDESEEEKGRNIRGMDEKGKKATITYILWMSMYLCEKCKISVSTLESVVSATQVMAVCYRIHDYARGKSNVSSQSKKTQKRDNQNFSFKATGKSFNITPTDALEIFEKAKKKYVAISSEGSFFADTASIVALMALHGQRMKELQIGPDSWISTKNEEGTVYHKLSTYGISPAYRHLASGLSWDVGIRNTLAKHTTGLCQLAILSNASGDLKYSNKTKINVQRDYGFLQHIEVISEFLQSHDKRSNAPILDRMAKITHLHGDKHKRRCSPSFSLIFQTCVSLQENEMADENCFTETISGEKKIYLIDVDPTIIGFSSKKAVLLYNKIKKIKIPSSANAELFKEAYFHATFGTQGEDFGILEFMTGRRNWNVREQFGNDFFNKSIKPDMDNNVSVSSTIPIQKYSKSISATQTNMLSSTGEIMGTMATFAGYRIVKYTKEEIDFASKIKGSTTGALDSSSASIMDYLSDVIKILREEITSGKNSDFFLKREGRVSWFDVSSATFEKGENGEKIAEVPESISRSFWSRK